MKKTLCAGLFCAMSWSAMAAPLFPDVKDEHWAKDAVAKLAAQGLLEGYPDGTFKGDRAATRWEVAMMVARLLAKMEQAHATFATKAELDEVRKLALSLKEELNALGVRVTNLEESVGRLDKRVTELERITFYGEIQCRVGAQSFHNTGRDNMTSVATGAQTIDYNASVGSALGAGGFLAAPSPGAGLPNNYFVTGIPGVTDWLTGRPLVNGATFTVLGLLGVNVKVSDDIEGGMELKAFTSQGNQIIDAFWGISAPYQNNVFSSTTTSGFGPANAGLQPLNNAPFSRMVLDNAWFRHKPSGTKVILGSFGNTNYDPIVYSMMPNPTVGGPAHLNSFGFQVTGQHLFGEDDKSPKLTYEVMGTKLADGNVDLVTGSSLGYWSHAEGANIALHFDEGRGVGRLNWLHAANDASAGAAGQVGLTQLPNLVSSWVNPAGFYTNQLALTQRGGIGSTSDQRPVPMGGATDGITGVPGTLNVGGIGPQDQTSYGLSLHYNWDSEYKPRVFGEFGHSDYKPSKNSSYGVGGNAFRIGAGASFFDDQLDVDLHYLRVDPTYDPFVLQIPTIGGISTPMWRIPDLNQFWNLYSLHDTASLPHNRQGLRANLAWKFNPNGKLSFSYGNLQQVRSSMQDVRFSAGSLAPGTPNTSVLGYSPGFMDPVFLGYAPQTFAAAGGNALAVPLEDNKGTMEHFLVSASHKWKFDDNSPEGVTLSGLFLNYNFRRNSNLAGILPGPLGIRGENQNRVDFTIQGWNLGVGYDVTKDFALRAGFTQLNVFGHIDPLGVYSDYAASTGNTRFNSWDITQNIPEIGFDWSLSEKSSWGMTAKFYSETDHIPSYVTASPSLPSLNVALSPQNAHPFGYSGIQLMSTYSLRF
ncbi:MAG: S-layer homology domain-containing protein [Vulcanimicrobiota bacterium]